MIYPFTLKPMMIVVGLLLIVTHLVALVRPGCFQEALKKFPRSYTAGVVLMIFAGAWFVWLVNNMDLGEFTPMRSKLNIGGPVATILAILYMREFLAVRAWGMILLLAAEPMLEAAFMRDETARLFLVCFAYANIIAALFWVGMPYLMRDLISWITANQNRWRMAAFAGLAYGIVMLVAGLMVGSAVQ